MILDERKIADLGHSASGLLKNKAFDAAFQLRYEQHIMDWLSTKPEDVDQREHYWRSIQELFGVISLMENFAEEKDTLLASE